MNDELKRDLGTAAAGLAAAAKQMISTGRHTQLEFWRNTETEILSQFQDILVKHKDSHSIEELIFFSLILGQVAQQTMSDLYKFEKESKDKL